MDYSNLYRTFILQKSLSEDRAPLFKEISLLRIKPSLGTLFYFPFRSSSYFISTSYATLQKLSLKEKFAISFFTDALRGLHYCRSFWPVTHYEQAQLKLYFLN